MKNLRRQILLAGFALAVLALASTAAEACPSCQAALANSEEGQKLVRGYFWSICFMLAMPFTIFGGISGYLYWLVRNARRNGPPGGSPKSRTPSSAAARVESPADEPVAC